MKESFSGNIQDFVDNAKGEIVIADENMEIVYMNKEAIKKYEKDGGSGLIGKSLLGCHSKSSQDEIRRMYESFSNGDLAPWQYRIQEEGYVDMVTVMPVISNDILKGCMEFVAKTYDPEKGR
jgi:transcriptional regulator with PAS, ATPase and Fis domain